MDELHPKRFFVSGCAGFLGAAVCRQLILAGHEVVGIDNLNPDYDPLVKRFRLAALAEEPRFRCHTADLARWSELERTFDWALRERAFDAVLHFAGRAGNGAMRPLAAFKVATAGTLRLLELCRRHGVPRFLLASGEGPALAASEGLCHAHHHMHDTHVAVLRFREVYGPAGRPDRALFRYVRWISEGEPAPVPDPQEPPVDYVYLDDAVRGVLEALATDGYRTWEIASGQRVPLGEVIEVLSILVGRPARLVRTGEPSTDGSTGEVAGYAAAPSTSLALPAWQPTVSLASGLCATLDWYETCRDVASLIDLGMEGRRRSRRTAARYRTAQRRDAA